jgi:hypothetical protein
MTLPLSDYAVLLRLPGEVEIDLAQELLGSAGIPTLLHPRDSRGLMANAVLPFESPDLYVPRDQRAKAEAILREAWGDEVFEHAHVPPPDQEGA